MFDTPENEWSNDDSEQAETADRRGLSYETLAWVKASERRQDVLRTLSEGPENTTTFKNEWGVTTADVPRRYIKELQDEGLVECLTPGRNRYRLYGLTEKGEAMVEQL